MRVVGCPSTSVGRRGSAAKMTARAASHSATLFSGVGGPRAMAPASAAQNTVEVQVTAVASRWVGPTA